MQAPHSRVTRNNSQLHGIANDCPPRGANHCHPCELIKEIVGGVELDATGWRPSVHTAAVGAQPISGSCGIRSDVSYLAELSGKSRHFSSLSAELRESCMENRRPVRLHSVCASV